MYLFLINFQNIIDKILNMCKKMRKRRRWSLVRILVSFLPEILWKYVLPGPIRPHCSQNLNLYLPKIKCDTCQMHSSPKNFTSFRSFLDNSKKTSEIGLSSTPKLELSNRDNKISDIQKDLNQLKDQVARILRQQQEKLKSSDYRNLSGQSKNNQISLISNTQDISHSPPPPPPPPPPLPPPFPPNHLITRPSQGLITKPRVDKQRHPKPPVEGFPCGEELLKDLKRVQLKKVQKSPGGGPLKKSKQDPGNFLEEVLKKRFNYIQNVSSDASHDSIINIRNGSFDEAENYSQSLKNSSP